jgi:hypothetical protein
MVIAALIAATVGTRTATAQNPGAALGFAVKCDFRTNAFEDYVTDNPTHLHVFFGGAGPDAGNPLNVDGEWLRTGYPTGSDPTTCDVNGDKAQYWIPTVKKDILNASGTGVKETVLIRPTDVHAYYRAHGLTNAKLWPKNLELLIGNPSSTVYQDNASWQCAGGTDDNVSEDFSNTPINCPGPNARAKGILSEDIPVMRIDGPECYKDANGDGTPDTIKAGDYKSHTAFSNPENSASCPAGFVRGVAIDLAFRYPVGTNFGPRVYLSSDPASVKYPDYTGRMKTAHSDFIDGWNRTVLEELRVKCIADGDGCSVQETEQIANN